MRVTRKEKKKSTKPQSLVQIVKPPVGLYAYGRQESFLYCESYTPPVVSKKGVQHKDRLIPSRKGIVVVAEALGATPVEGWYYLPSCRVEKGMVMRVSVKQSYSYEVLVRRFASSIKVRSFYVFTRVNFRTYDTYREFFAKSWVLPKRREEANKTLMFNDVEGLSADVKDLYNYQIAVEEFPGKPAAITKIKKATQTQVNEWKSSVSTFSIDTLKTILQSSNDNNLAELEELIRSTMGISSFVQFLKNLILDKSTVELLNKKKAALGAQTKKSTPSDIDGDIDVTQGEEEEIPPDIDDKDLDQIHDMFASQFKTETYPEADAQDEELEEDEYASEPE